MSNKSQQVCSCCGWSKVTTYHGLRVHRGKKGCTPKGMRIPESQQAIATSYIPRLPPLKPAVQLEDTVVDIFPSSLKPAKTGAASTKPHLVFNFSDGAQPLFMSVSHTVTNQIFPEANLTVMETKNTFFQTPQRSHPTTTKHNARRALEFSTGAQQLQQMLGCPKLENEEPVPLDPVNNVLSRTRHTHSTVFQTPLQSHPTTTTTTTDNPQQALLFSTGTQQLQQMFGCPKPENKEPVQMDPKNNALSRTRDTHSTVFQTPLQSHPTTTTTTTDNPQQALVFSTGVQQLQQMFGCLKLENEEPVPLDPVNNVLSRTRHTHSTVFQTPLQSHPTTTTTTDNPQQALLFSTGTQQLQQMFGCPKPENKEPVQMDPKNNALSRTRDTHSTVFQTPLDTHPTTTTTTDNPQQALVFSTGVQKLQQMFGCPKPENEEPVKLDPKNNAQSRTRDTHSTVFQTPLQSHPTTTTTTTDNPQQALEFSTGTQQLQQMFGCPKPENKEPVQMDPKNNALSRTRDKHSTVFQTPLHTHPTTTTTTTTDNPQQALVFSTGAEHLQQMFGYPKLENEEPVPMDPVNNVLSRTRDTHSTVFQTPLQSHPTTTTTTTDNPQQALVFSTGVQKLQQMFGCPKPENEEPVKLDPKNNAPSRTRDTHSTVFQTPLQSHPTTTTTTTDNPQQALEFSTGAEQLQQMFGYPKLENEEPVPLDPVNNDVQPAAWKPPASPAVRPKKKDMEKEREAQKLLKAKQDKRRAELQQNIQIRKEKVAEVKSYAKACKVSLDAEWLEINSVFCEVMKVVEDAWQKALEPLEKRRQRVKRTTQDLVQKLQREMDEFKKSIDELDKPPELKVTVDESTDWKTLSVDTSFSLGTLKTTTTTMMEQIEEELDKLSSVELQRIPTYAVDVQLDPFTAHQCLIISNDRKNVRDGEKFKQVVDTAERFDIFGSVLGVNSLTSGRSYWEVEVSNKSGWDLGVARGDANRKGILTLNPESGYWVIVHYEDEKYAALTAPPVCLPLKGKPQKVGVFVDYEEGLVSFYDVTARSHIYSFTKCSFRGKIFPYFSPHLEQTGKNADPLIICAVKAP